jgi:hypothetical protein
MVTLLSLWLPVVLSAVFAFIASCIVHMLLGYHRADFAKLQKEDEILEGLAPLELPPGEYVFPWSDCGKDANKAEYKAKLDRGPAGFVTVFPRGPLGMGQSLVLWFLYCVVVSVFAGYAARLAAAPGAEYLHVFRVAGTTAFAGYSLGLLQNSIWYRRSWLTTAKSMFDGLLYALVTGGTFGWLWPA